MGSQNRPAVEPTCTYDIDGNDGLAYPGIRLKSLASDFNTLATMTTFAYSPICADDFANSLHNTGTAISTSLGFSRL